MALICSAENAGPQYGGDEFNQMIADYQSITERFNKGGVLISVDCLQDVTQ